MNVAQESLDFRWTTFSVVLSLLMPTSAFLSAPVYIAVRLHPLRDLHALQSLNRMLPYHVTLARDIHSFGTKFKSRELLALSRLTSELLRTL